MPEELNGVQGGYCWFCQAVLTFQLTTFKTSFLDFAFIFVRPHGKCPLIADYQLGIVETSFFYRPFPRGAGCILHRYGCLVAHGAAEWCRRLWVGNQTTNVLSPIPMAAFGFRHGQVLRPTLRSFNVKCSTRKLSSAIKHEVEQPWPSKLGQ